MVECPTCGRDGFKSERSMKSHHTKVHNFKLNEFKETEEWLKNGPVKVNDADLDRFVRHIERRIQRNAERHNLKTQG